MLRYVYFMVLRKIDFEISSRILRVLILEKNSWGNTSLVQDCHKFMYLWASGHLQNPSHMKFLLIKKNFLGICYVGTLSPQVFFFPPVSTIVKSFLSVRSTQSNIYFEKPMDGYLLMTHSDSSLSSAWSTSQ